MSAASLPTLAERFTIIGSWALAAGIFGLSFGAVGVSGGASPTMLVVMSLVVYGPSSQFGTLSVLIIGGGAPAAVASGLMLNARLFAMALMISSRLQIKPMLRFLAAHLVIDASVLLSVSMTDPRSLRRMYFEAGLGVWTLWVFGTFMGTLLAARLGDMDRFGVDVAVPAMFLALIVPLLTDRRAWISAISGGIIALALTPLLPPGLPVLLASSGCFVGMCVRRDPQ